MELFIGFIVALSAIIVFVGKTVLFIIGAIVFAMALLCLIDWMMGDDLDI